MVSIQKKKLAILFLFGTLFFFAQEQKHPFYYNKLIKTTGTISPGIMFATGKTTAYFHGFLEFFPEDRVSYRGDIFYFKGEQEKPGTLDQNSTLKWGLFYHWHKKKKFDFYTGIQPGLNFVQPKGQDLNGKDFYYTFKVVPIISPVAGTSFYFGRFFNMFAEVCYVQGRYLGDAIPNINLSEVRFSFGLGFHLVTAKSDCNCSGRD